MGVMFYKRKSDGQLVPVAVGPAGPEGPEGPQGAPGYSDYGIVRWNGTGWRYKGATITVRPTDVPAWPDGHLLWDTSLHSDVTTPPPLAAVGDKWMPHGSVSP